MATALVLSGGGPLAVAWECGLAAGLARAGLALNSADFILGTSAGAIVGAQLAAGRNPEAMVNTIIAETHGVPPPGGMPHYPIAAVMKLPDLFALSHTGEVGCVEVGSYALSASMTETETAYVERMKLAIGIDDWPDREIGVVAVDVADGKSAVLRRECGATIAAAIAASCCLPGLSPPVSISGRHYMDGGMRSTANADLASGFDSVLVLCFHPPGQPGERMLTRVTAQSEALVKAGVRVSVISPDQASLAAIGPRTMDVVRRPEVARAALAQGAAAVDAVARFWEETHERAQ
jgi:NTE family protein